MFTHLWSLCIEEQFYLVWPVILKFIPGKIYPVVFTLVILLTLLFRSFYTGNSEHDYAVRQFHTLAIIGDMALGGLMAYYCSYKSRFFNFIVNLKKWQIFLVYFIAVLIIFFRKDLFNSPLALIFERLIIALFCRQ